MSFQPVIDDELVRELRNRGSFAYPRDGSLQYDTLLVAAQTGLECKDPSLAVQSEKEEADINVIVKRFGVGNLPNVRPLPPTQEDFAEAFDFMSAQNLLVEADRAFMAQPAEVRERFGNNAGKFVEFCSDVETNGEEMVKLGLAVKRPPVVEPAPAKVQIVNPEALSDGKEKGK